MRYFIFTHIYDELTILGAANNLELLNTFADDDALVFDADEGVWLNEDTGNLPRIETAYSMIAGDSDNSDNLADSYDMFRHR